MKCSTREYTLDLECRNCPCPCSTGLLNTLSLSRHCRPRSRLHNLSLSIPRKCNLSHWILLLLVLLLGLLYLLLNILDFERCSLLCNLNSPQYHSPIQNKYKSLLLNWLHCCRISTPSNYIPGILTGSALEFLRNSKPGCKS